MMAAVEAPSFFSCRDGSGGGRMHGVPAVAAAKGGSCSSREDPGTAWAASAATDASAATRLFNARNRTLERGDVEGLLGRFLGPPGSFAVRDLSVYRRAMVHHSYTASPEAKLRRANERCPPTCMPLQEGSYERLEFLGDAVLGLATASYLFRRYPDEDEGFLTRMRTKLINGRMLTGLCARHTPLPAFAVFSQPLFGDVCDRGGQGPGGGGGPNNHQHRQQQRPGKGKKHKKDQNQQQQQQPTRARTLTQYERMLEDVFEAFLGAIFVDQGFDAASRWIVGFLEENVDFAELVATQENDKDLLNRHYMQTFGYVPIIEELSDTVARIVTPGGAVISTGIGPTPRAARDAAVRNALNIH